MPFAGKLKVKVRNQPPRFLNPKHPGEILEGPPREVLERIHQSIPNEKRMTLDLWVRQIQADYSVSDLVQLYQRLQDFDLWGHPKPHPLETLCRLAYGAPHSADTPRIEIDRLQVYDT